MKDAEVSRIHVNHTVRDSELEEAEALLQDIDPGRYRVKDGAVVRFSGEPLTNPRTLAFFAAAWSIIPRFILGLRTLETALRQAWIEASSAERELSESREGRKEDALRRSEGKTGPERELRLVARYLAACAELPSSMGRDPNDTTYIEQLLRRWAGGESVAHELASSVDSLEARAKEHRAFHAKYDAEQKAEVVALKARLLEAIDEVARGQIREELKKPLRDAKKRLKAAGYIVTWGEKCGCLKNGKSETTVDLVAAESLAADRSREHLSATISEGGTCAIIQRWSLGNRVTDAAPG